MSGTIDRRGATPPDFLVKLLTMVGDEAPDLISWTGGKLYIHDPVALERKMSVYFRHSNFSSFQRQLNNFGFRKVEGKGKLAPCMYMHDDLVQTRRLVSLHCESLRRFYFLDMSRLRERRRWVVSFPILRCLHTGWTAPGGDPDDPKEAGDVRIVGPRPARRQAAAAAEGAAAARAAAAAAAFRE